MSIPANECCCKKAGVNATFASTEHTLAETYTCKNIEIQVKQPTNVNFALTFIVAQKRDECYASYQDERTRWKMQSREQQRRREEPGHRTEEQA
jgi:hypothetical protein